MADRDSSTPPAGSGRRAAGGVLAAACVSTLVVNANTSAVTILLPSISEDVGAPVAELQWAVTGYSLVGAAVIVTSGALGRRVRTAEGVPRRPGALRRLVRADRAVHERRPASSAGDDPGRRRCDDPGVRHGPAVRRLLRSRTDEGDHAVGRSVRSGCGDRATRRRAARRTHGLARSLLDRRRDRRRVHPPHARDRRRSPATPERSARSTSPAPSSLR